MGERGVVDADDLPVDDSERHAVGVPLARVEAERLGDGTVGVGQQVEVESRLVGELRVALDVVGRDAVDRDSVAANPRELRLDVVGLDGTAVGESFG